MVHVKISVGDSLSKLLTVKNISDHHIEVRVVHAFYLESDCLGCAVLLCFVVCLTLLASFFLPSASL